MSEITFDSKAYKSIMDKLEFLETAVKAMSARQGLSKYMSEEEVMQVTGLGKDALRKHRRDNVLHGFSSTGRKLQYLRKEVEAYMNGDLASKVYAIRESKKQKTKQTA